MASCLQVLLCVREDICMFVLIDRETEREESLRVLFKRMDGYSRKTLYEI